MERFLSSYGMVSVFCSRTEKIELSFVDKNSVPGVEEAEMAMQEYFDSLPTQDNGKFGKNEVGRAEEFEPNCFIADVY